MTLRLVTFAVLSALAAVRAQEDLIRMMMLSSLLSGGGFGGGGQSAPQQNTHMMTGFEGDPRSSGSATGISSQSSNPGGLFGGLMGLLSRNAGGNAAPLLLDVDGDILRSQLWQRGLLGGTGAGSPGAGHAEAGPASPVNHRDASPVNSPLVNGAAPSGTGAHPARARSMPLHIEFASNAGPAESKPANERQNYASSSNHATP
ncbi:uncharacterized protein LOC129599517 isoform X1 [Paramacrobiotus metropolitanus]|uniref:uncharacterized protein LOC129599517 isoform X1 n=1 Tax=Paramacrobiotus metropolitanus TaxID=2943436 RepID=UPI0024457444|nr:uncharacterized protein LOC129599517 isoform X1 [Paramacrobiotus metropolitanus]